ncbi:MAG: thioredoxin family protein [Candidatus Mariimomonas ferrooxydans]
MILKAFRLEEVERIPWVPFVGIHGAKLIGVPGDEYLKSAELISKGATKAVQLYKPDGLPVTFDLQIEAEAMGCQLAWSPENPPAVISHPLSEGETLADLAIPGKEDARVKIVPEATGKIRKNHPDIALYGLVTGPFTLALHLMGTDIFIKMFEDEAHVKEILDFTNRMAMAMVGYYLEAGCDIIAVVDPMTSQIGPDQFSQFITTPVRQLFEHIRSNGGLGSFFVCGYAQQNIEVMCDCTPDNVSIDENIPLDFVRDICLERKISFGGNLKLTVVLLMGNPDDCQEHALETMELGKQKGFILAPGCDLPMATPEENLAAITELVNDPYKQDVVRAMEKKEIDLILPDMKDYGQADRVVVDIITLDSESCAPCQYMVEAVKKVVPEFEGIVEWREHSIKQLDAVTFMSALMVKNLPTICIDGKIVFVSKIPPRQELIAAIQARINEKMRMRLKLRKAEVLILGKNQEECQQLEGVLKQAIKELGPGITHRFITEEQEILSYGVMQTPAFIVQEFKVKSQGSEPSVEVVKEWIKELI